MSRSMLSASWLGTLVIRIRTTMTRWIESSTTSLLTLRMIWGNVGSIGWIEIVVMTRRASHGSMRRTMGRRRTMTVIEGEDHILLSSGQGKLGGGGGEQGHHENKKCQRNKRNEDISFLHSISNEERSGIGARKVLGEGVDEVEMTRETIAIMNLGLIELLRYSRVVKILLFNEEGV